MIVVIIIIVASTFSRLIEVVIIVVARSLEIEVKIKLIALHLRPVFLVLLFVAAVAGVLSVTRALGAVAGLAIPEVHVVSGLAAVIVVAILSFALLLLPHDVLLVTLSDFLGSRLIDKMVVLLHPVVYIHETLIVDKQFELLTVL